MAPHVNDGDLLRFDDAELDAGERARVLRHLASCTHCRERHDALRTIAERVHVAYQETFVPPVLMTAPWHRSAAEIRVANFGAGARRRQASGRRVLVTAVRAAAAVAMIAAVAAASTPVRKWIATRHQPSGASIHVPRPAHVRGESPTSLPSHMASLSFVSSSDVLTIGLDARKGDSILVHASNSVAVRVRAQTTGDEPTLIAMPDRVQLVSAASGVTSYAVEVSPQIRIIEVRDHRRVLVRLTRDALEARGGWQGIVP
ncbi:MAG: zf-HC2 domain-containing protein [bacterium]